MNRILAALSLLPCILAGARAQIDSSRIGADTLGMLPPFEEALLEQSANLDGSSILDYLRDDRPRPSRPVEVRLRSQISQRLQPSAGYTGGAYGGSRLNVRQRVAVAWADLGGGLLVAKDPGEVLANALVTGYLSYRGEGVLREIVAGDYRIEAGQGIAMWKGRDFSRGSDILTPAVRNGRGIVPSLSADESTYLRGVAIRASANTISAAMFVSIRTYAASVDSGGVVRAFYSSGYYRTGNEVQKRGTLGERLLGARVSAVLAPGQLVGLTLYRTRFSAPLSLEGGARYAGEGYTLAALDYAGSSGGLSAFGELVVAGQTFAGAGGVARSSSGPMGTFSLAAAVRAYPLAFYSAHGSGFGDLPDSHDEYGMYCGVRAVPGRWISFSGYIDHTCVPMQQVLHFPSAGTELFGAVQLSMTGDLSAELQYYRSSKGAAPAAPDDGLQESEGGGKRLLQRVRVQGTYRFREGAELRIRCERSFLRSPAPASAGGGFLVYGDFTLRPHPVIWGNLRLVIFDTDSYASRIAEYERDLNGVASVPALYGSGIRWYLLLRLSPVKRIQLNVKYADLLRDDVRSIGTGLEALTTNHDNRLSAEIEATF